MITDPIGDYLTRIRNAAGARHQVVEIPSSRLKEEITRVLHEKGYIKSYKVVDEKPQKKIKIALKYNSQTKAPVIISLERISRPGLRRYVNHSRLPKVLDGLGIAILSTSKGVISDKEARLMNVGGEVLCYVY